MYIGSDYIWRKEEISSSSCSQGLLIKLEDYVMRLDIFAQGMKTEEKERKRKKLK